MQRNARFFATEKSFLFLILYAALSCWKARKVCALICEKQEVCLYNYLQYKIIFTHVLQRPEG